MATLSDDESMSSPDPLNDSIPSSMMRRMTRSQQSKKFMSLGAPSVSPRRQTFSLEVGDNRSPQKLFVTVESEHQQQNSEVRRRLFPSSSPTKSPTVRRRPQTTTTTIPLRDASDDEGFSTLSVTTPRKRGRPRKYAPTPVPRATSKKRAGSPAKKGTPGRPRKNTSLIEEPPSETSTQATPRASKTRKRSSAAGKELGSDAAVEATPASSSSKRGAKRKAAEEEPSSVPPSSGKRRGRPRKKPLVVEEMQEVPEEHSTVQAPSPVPVEPLSPAPLQSDPALAVSNTEPADNTLPPSEGDIWMDTLSNEPTPRPTARSQSLNMSTMTAEPAPHSPEEPSEHAQTDDYANDYANDYAPMAEARDDTPSIASQDAPERPIQSDVDDVMLVPKPVNYATSEAMSEASHMGVGRRARDQDTIMQSEEFSMIFMDSYRSSYADASAVPDASNEIGDNTNLFINKTLESIKEGMQSDVGGSERSVDGREESHDGRQNEGKEEEEQQTSPRYEPQQDTEQEPNHAEDRYTRHDADWREEDYSQNRPSPHYEPEPIADEDEVEGAPGEGDYPQEQASPLEATERYTRDESPGVEYGVENELAESHYTQEQASRVETSETNVQEEPDYAEYADEEEVAEEYLTQQPDWEADEAEASASESRSKLQLDSSPTPRNSSPLWSVSPRRNKAIPLGRQLLSFKAMQNQHTLSGESPSQMRFSPSRASLRREDFTNVAEESNAYEDSFSEVPDAVLEAATPRPQRLGVPLSNRSPEEQPEPQGKDATASGVSVATDTIRSDASRMLTPEETPSPHSAEEVAESRPTSTSAAPADRGPTHSRSISPTRVTQPTQFLAPQRSVQDEVTPVGPPSSPQLPALQDHNAHRATQHPESERRPTLSPIVRAGLALQSVTSDHSSPLGPKTLGSPFKASANSTPRMGSTQPREADQMAALRPTSRQPEMPGSSDDPFGPSRRNNGQDSFMRALDESARQLQAKRSSQPAALFDTTRATLDDADEMSWVAEDTVPAPMQQDTVASRSSSMAANFGSLAEREHAADAAAENDGTGSDEEEEDIWVTEAQRPTPKQPRQASFGAGAGQQAARRTLIPDTWRRKALATPAAKTAAEDIAQQNQLSDYSLLSSQLKGPTRRHESSAAKPKGPAGLDLSKFFSSPTVVPGTGHPAQRNVAPGRVPAQEAARTLPSNSMFPSVPQQDFQSSPDQPAPAPARTLPSNSLFSAIPQKDFQPSPARKNSLTTREAPAPAPAPTRSSDSMFAPVPQKEFQPSPVRRSRLFSSAASASAAPSIAEQTSPSRPLGTSIMGDASPSKSARTSVAAQQSAPSTPDRSNMRGVEQKQNFTPRRGQSSQSLFAPASARSSAPTPPQMQLSRNDIERWQEETSRVLNPPSDSPEAERQPAVPLPHRTMSPSKSCLRSPLKPRTPGRVVEFAAAGSPLQDAQARAVNARRNVPSVQLRPPQPKPSQVVLPQRKDPRAVVFEEDKENTPSDVSASEASPEKSNPLPERLSQKTWGKNHWRLLDTLIQLRKKGPFPFNLEAAGYVRRDRGLLGRVAEAGGERMEIRKWHVDVVDAFRAEVGGWDEVMLAKRVFALVAGEGRRIR